MKYTAQIILLILTLSLVATSCSKDSNDVQPPTAGFTLNSLELTQWDIATISNSSTSPIANSNVEYTVSGGEYKLDDESIQFLEVGTYTVTQTITNDDGSDSATLTVEVTAPNNVYTLDGSELSIGTTDKPNFYWYDGTAQGGTLYLRALGSVDGQDNPNLIKLMPVAGPNPIQADYTWSASGDIGTYDAGMTANYAGFNYDWTTNGDKGDNLTIDLVYKAPNSANNVYDITLSSYTLNYGNWNFVTGTFDSEGTKALTLSYRGKIDPAN